jgi:hypothetical protein
MSDYHGMTRDERCEDALAYCDYVLSLDRWGHGPIPMADAIKMALMGGGLPDDCLEWMGRVAWTLERSKAEHAKRVERERAYRAAEID